MLSMLLFVSCPSKEKQPEAKASHADTLEWPASFGFGRSAMQAEIDSIDIDVRPDGHGLPAGSGNVISGSVIYRKKCAHCHGKTGTEGPYNPLVAKDSSSRKGEKTIGNYWPYATTLYDYIYRAMPYDKPGSLSSSEVYSLTAFLLDMNGIIDTSAISDENLPKVVMPAQKLFVNDDRTDGPEIK